MNKHIYLRPGQVIPKDCRIVSINFAKNLVEIEELDESPPTDVSNFSFAATNDAILHGDHEALAEYLTGQILEMFRDRRLELGGGKV